MGGLLPIATVENDGFMPSFSLETSISFKSGHILLYQGFPGDWHTIGFQLTIIRENLSDMFLFSGTNGAAGDTGSIFCERIAGSIPYEFYFKKESDKTIKIYIKQSSPNSSKFIHRIPMVGLNPPLQKIEDIDFSALTPIPIK